MNSDDEDMADALEQTPSAGPDAQDQSKYHCCPFKNCARSLSRGAGWGKPLELFLHINSVHLSCGQRPSPGFLAHYGKDVCPTCATLIKTGKSCPSCRNREKRSIQRWTRQPTQPDSSPPSAAPLSQASQDEPIPAPFVADNDAFDSTLPDLETILRAPIDTSIHVPKPFRPQWNTILNQLLSNFLETGSRTAFQQLMMAPKCLFAPLPRAGSRKGKQVLATLSKRFTRWQQGDLNSLWTAALKTARDPSKSSPIPPQADSNADADEFDSSLARRVTQAVAEGAFSKGLTLLSGDSRLAPSNSQTVAALQALHPTGPRLQPVHTGADAFRDQELTAKKVLRSLNSFGVLSAPGPSGLRATHLREALRKAKTN